MRNNFEYVLDMGCTSGEWVFVPGRAVWGVRGRISLLSTVTCSGANNPKADFLDRSVLFFLSPYV
jgi:hypothetical protein